MVWIALAVGGVLGTTVFLVITAARWSTTRISRRRQWLDSSSPGHRAVELGRGASQRERRDAALSVVESISQETGDLRTDVVWTITESGVSTRSSGRPLPPVRTPSGTS